MSFVQLYPQQPRHLKCALNEVIQSVLVIFLEQQEIGPKNPSA